MLSVHNTSKVEAPWIHAFFYGDSGSGKTTAAATFPRPLFVVPQNENSVVSLLGRNIDYVTCTGQLGPYRDGSGGMDAIMKEIENQYRANPANFPYDTIVIESLSHYTDLVQEELTQGSMTQMDQPKWGKLASHLRNLHSRLRRLDVHVVFTALQKVDLDAAGVAMGGPLIPGQMAYKLPTACDIYAYLEVRSAMVKGVPTKQHFMYTHKRGHFPARSRFPQLPGEIESFDFAKHAHLFVNPAAGQDDASAEATVSETGTPATN